MPIFDSQYPVNSNPAGEDKILTTDTSDSSAIKSVTLTKVQEWLGSTSKWVTNGMIADQAVTADKIDPMIFTWEPWVNPVDSGITIGNGTLVAKYFKIGSQVNFFFQFILGSTSAVTGDVLLTPPVPFSSSFAMGRQPLGNSSLVDAGTTARSGECHVEHLGTNSRMRVTYYTVSSSFIGPGAISSTMPFTWTINDSLLAIGSYESAS